MFLYRMRSRITQGACPAAGAFSKDTIKLCHHVLHHYERHRIGRRTLKHKERGWRREAFSQDSAHCVGDRPFRFNSRIRRVGGDRPLLRSRRTRRLRDSRAGRRVFIVVRQSDAAACGPRPEPLRIVAPGPLRSLRGLSRPGQRYRKQRFAPGNPNGEPGPSRGWCACCFCRRLDARHEDGRSPFGNPD
jgi:hypothetical protein